MSARGGVAIVGPTASGKSSVALAAAELLGDVELVSVDSMQVYAGMDIGTAKPDRSERDRVRHHLIDLVQPSEEFTVAEFQRRFDATVSEIAARGHRPILVGGTGLYHRAVIDDLDIPGEWPDQRRLLVDRARTEGLDGLYAELVERDPVAAERIEPGNERRIIRALEVCRGSGRPFSAFGPGLEVYPAQSIPQVGLRWDRDVLTGRISDRVHAMMAAGFLDEVTSLATGPLSKTAGQALGYRELLEHLRGEVTLDEAVQRIIVRTRQFAVRQERWFRRDPRIIWVDVTSDPVSEALPVVLAQLSNATGPA